MSATLAARRLRYRWFRPGPSRFRKHATRIILMLLAAGAIWLTAEPAWVVVAYKDGPLVVKVHFDDQCEGYSATARHIEALEARGISRAAISTAAPVIPFLPVLDPLSAEGAKQRDLASQLSCGPGGRWSR